MSFFQFMQVLYAGRWRLLICTLACFATAMFVGLRLPKTYEARARVLMEVVQPDLVTDVMVNNKGIESFVRTQQLLVSSERVGLSVVDKLGWATNPAVLDAFLAQNDGVGDIRHWAARRVMGSTQAYPLEGAGTLEILYQAPDPVAAATIVGLIREAYIETSLALQTEGAARRANRFDQLVSAARRELVAAETRLRTLQREAGVVATPGGVDIEHGNLDSLGTTALRSEVGALGAAQTATASANRASSMSALRSQLQRIERQLGTVEGPLGDNNPAYRGLIMQRDAVRANLARAANEGSARVGASVAMARGMAAQAEANYRAERTRVLGRSEINLALERALRDVKARRGDVVRLETSAGTSRLQAERTESGLVILGDVIGSDIPSAPVIPVIAAISIAFGFGLGFCSVLLDGLWRREVLGTDDLMFATGGVPVLGFVPAGKRERRNWVDAWQQRWRAARIRAAG